MASKAVKSAKSKSDELVSFGLTAIFIAGGYYVWKSSRKDDLISMDASEARPTRHMVPIEARLDREKLAKWLDDEQSHKASLAEPHAAPAPPAPLR